MFDESKHPRDNDGKFTDKNGGSYSDGVNERVRWAKENGIDLPLNLDGSVDDLKLQGIYEKRKRPVKAVGFANKERKNTAHHICHAKEMGFSNQDEYESATVDFFNSNNGKLYYNEHTGRHYGYDPKKALLVVSSNGIIHTFMNYSEKRFTKKIGEEGLYEC